MTTSITTLSKRPTHPRTSPPARPETPPTPELTFASILHLSSANLWEAKAPPPLDHPLYLSSTSTHSEESNHGSPVVSPYATSSASTSLRSSGSEFESISLKSLSSEALGREEDEAIRPPAPAFLREHSGVDTQGRMMWRPTMTTYVPYPRGVGLPFAIIEEEEPPEGGEEETSDHASSYYSAESGSLRSQEQEREKKREAESRSTTIRSEESDFDDRKEKKRKSLGKRIKRMFVEKRDAVRLGLKV